VGALWEIDAGVVGANELAVNACTEPKLDIIDSPADEESLTYETTGGRFEWEARISGATTNGGLVTAGAAGAPTLGVRTDCGANQILKYVSSVWTCAADDAGGGGGAPTTAQYITGANDAGLSADIFTSSADRVPVSNGTTATWAQVPSGALADNACTEPKLDVLDTPADEEVLTYESTGGRFEWQPNITSLTVDGSPVSSPALSDGGDIDFAAAGSNITGAVKANSVALTTDTTGNYIAGPTSNGGLVMTGTEGGTLGMRTDCPTGYVLKRDALGWGCSPDLNFYDPCGTDGRCRVLTDVDADTDYADDLQKIINDLAYSSYTTVVVTNESNTVATAEKFFGITVGASQTAADPYDELNNEPIAILQGGTCVSGSQIATINTNGTITGDVTSSGITVTGDSLNCSAGTCASGSSSVEYLDGPVDWNGLVCHRSGATDATFTSAGTCTGGASFCAVTEVGSITLIWSAGSGDTDCDYTRKATNTINLTNGATNGQFTARWTATPSATTQCTYTYVSSANGGLSATEFTVVPPVTPAKLDFKSQVKYCRQRDSETPIGYTVPTCTGQGTTNDDLPVLRWHKNWDAAEIACNPPLQGGGATTACFKMSDESQDGTSATNRPGTYFEGAPLVSMVRTGVTPGTDFYYGFWFDGIDDSTIRLRFENTGDTDTVAGVIVGDSSAIELGSRTGAALSPLNGIVYVDGPNTTGLNFSGLSTQPFFRHPDVIFGSVFAGYNDPGEGSQVAGAINGCEYSAGVRDTCDSITIDSMNNSIDVEGIPRDFVIINQTGDVEYHSDSSPGTTDMFPQPGPASTHCKHCTNVRLHGNNLATGGLITTDSFTFSGVIDSIWNDAITGLTPFAFHRFTVMQITDYAGSFGSEPFKLGPVGAHTSPGLIALTGGRQYEYYTDDLATVSGNVCMRKRGSLAYTSVACTDPDAISEYLPGRSFLGRVMVELTKDVESTATECDLAIEIAGGCTSCADGETGGGKVFKIGGQDIWGRNLRAAGDWTQWALNDAVTAGQNITAELRPVSSGTACTAGSGCSCTGVAGLKVTVDELPALYDQP